jgi:ABC-type dipeptide/oligopeptide/nickel transport system permease component
MLRYALRRALWAVPTLFGISLIVFLLSTMLPDPPEALGPTGPQALAHDPARFAAAVEARRARFLDLPRFFNTKPKDVRARTEECVLHIVAEDEEAPVAAFELARLGGATFPYLLPKLDNLPPGARGRVAVALAPIAERMGLENAAKLRDPEEATLFWIRFWEDRSVDFTTPSVHRVVQRLLKKTNDMRERELVYVDTFALAETMEAMKTTRDRQAIAKLTSIAAHAANRGIEVTTDADDALVKRALADWQSWWFVHRADYVALDGAERVAATLGDTRYGKWMLGAVTGELGLSTRDERPVFEKLLVRAPITLLMTFVAIGASFALAIPLGVISAWRRGKPVDRALAVALFAFYSLPTFFLAAIAMTTFGVAPLGGVDQSSEAVREWLPRLALPTLVLTLGSLATLSRYQRASLLEVLGQDYVRTATAKGLPARRVLVVHALRNAMMPTVTLAGLQFPTLLGGAFVVEELFGIPGLGWETLRAVEARDAVWLITVVLATAVVSTAALIASDVAYGVLDPRVRESLGRTSGGHA